MKKALIAALQAAAEEQSIIGIYVDCPACSAADIVTIRQMRMINNEKIELTDHSGFEYTIDITGDITQEDDDIYLIMSGNSFIVIEFQPTESSLRIREPGIKAGDRIYSPRFGMVNIEKVYETQEDAAAAGFTEPTHIYEERYEVVGKSLDSLHMVFAAYLI